MKLGVPSVVAVTERFQELACGVAESRKVPDFPVVILPSDVEQRDDADLTQIGRRALDETLQALVPNEEAHGDSG